MGVEALPYSAVDDQTAEQLLRIGGVSAVAISDQGVMRQLLQAPNLPRAPDFIDLRRRSLGARLLDPVRDPVRPPDRSIRARAAPRYRSGDFIDVVAPAEPLKLELRAFLLNSLLVSILISRGGGRPALRRPVLPGAAAAAPGDPLHRRLRRRSPRPSPRRPPTATTRSAGSSANWPACRTRCARPCAPAPAWWRWARRWPRSTTTCATC